MAGALSGGEYVERLYQAMAAEAADELAGSEQRAAKRALRKAELKVREVSAGVTGHLPQIRALAISCSVICLKVCDAVIKHTSRSAANTVYAALRVSEGEKSLLECKAVANPESHDTSVLSSSQTSKA